MQAGMPVDWEADLKGEMDSKVDAGSSDGVAQIKLVSGFVCAGEKNLAGDTPLSSTPTPTPADRSCVATVTTTVALSGGPAARIVTRILTGS